MSNKYSSNYIGIREHHNVVRGILEGKLIYAACLSCNSSGYENWNEDGEDVRPGKPTTVDRGWGECETCDGLGYVVRLDNT